MDELTRTEMTAAIGISRNVDLAAKIAAIVSKYQSVFLGAEVDLNPELFLDSLPPSFHEGMDQLMAEEDTDENGNSVEPEYYDGPPIEDDPLPTLEMMFVHNTRHRVRLELLGSEGVIISIEDAFVFDREAEIMDSLYFIGGEWTERDEKLNEIFSSNPGLKNVTEGIKTLAPDIENIWLGEYLK